MSCVNTHLVRSLCYDNSGAIEGNFDDGSLCPDGGGGSDVGVVVVVMVGMTTMLVVTVVFVLMVVVIKSRKRLVLKWCRKPNSSPMQIIIFILIVSS